MWASNFADNESTSFWVLSFPPGGVREWQRAESEEAAEQVAETERRRSDERGLSAAAAAAEVERSERRLSRAVSLVVMSDHLPFKIWTREADSERDWSWCCMSATAELMGSSSAVSFMAAEEDCVLETAKCEYTGNWKVGEEGNADAG